MKLTVFKIDMLGIITVQSLEFPTNNSRLKIRKVYQQNN